MNYLGYLRAEARLIKGIADNESKKPQLREAFKAKYELYQGITKMLKTGVDRAHVLSILTEMKNDLTIVQDPTWTQIGQRQAAFELIRILREG